MRRLGLNVRHFSKKSIAWEQVRDELRCHPKRTSSLAPWNMALKSLPFLNGRARMYSRDLGDEMA
jgi:hypothetical protein